MNETMITTIASLHKYGHTEVKTEAACAFGESGLIITVTVNDLTISQFVNKKDDVERTTISLLECAANIFGHDDELPENSTKNSSKAMPSKKTAKKTMGPVASAEPDADEAEETVTESSLTIADKQDTIPVSSHESIDGATDAAADAEPAKSDCPSPAESKESSEPTPESIDAAKESTEEEKCEKEEPSGDSVSVPKESGVESELSLEEAKATILTFAEGANKEKYASIAKYEGQPLAGLAKKPAFINLLCRREDAGEHIVTEDTVRALKVIFNAQASRIGV